MILVSDMDQSHSHTLMACFTSVVLGSSVVFGGKGKCSGPQVSCYSKLIWSVIICPITDHHIQTLSLSDSYTHLFSINVMQYQYGIDQISLHDNCTTQASIYSTMFVELPLLLVHSGRCSPWWVFFFFGWFTAGTVLGLSRWCSVLKNSQVLLSNSLLWHSSIHSIFMHIYDKYCI